VNNFRHLLIFDRCHGGSSRGGCSTGAEVAGTAQVPITSSSPSSNSSNTGSSSRRLSTFRRLDQRFHLQLRRRNIIPFLLHPRPHGTMASDNHTCVNDTCLKFTLVKRQISLISFEGKRRHPGSTEWRRTRRITRSPGTRAVRPRRRWDRTLDLVIRMRDIRTRRILTRLSPRPRLRRSTRRTSQ